MSGGLLVGALAVMAAGPAQGVATAPAGIKAYATGTAVHVAGLQAGETGPQVADVLQAHSAGAFNSGGLPTAGQASEVNGTVIPTPGTEAMDDGLVPPGREAYARGAGIDVGLGSSLPNTANEAQLVLAGIAGAASFAPKGSSTPVVGAAGPTQTGLIEETVDIPASPLVYAGALRGRALANWNSTYAMPMLGTPIAYGEGYAADVQLVNAGATNPAGGFLAGLLNTDAPGPERAVSNTKSYTYLVNNGDGTCGVATEIHQNVAPVRLNLPPDADTTNDLTIEVGGEWVMRGVATGKAPATLTYDVGDVDDPTEILRIIDGTDITNILGFDDLFGDEGLDLFGGTGLDTVANVVVAEPPRAIAAPGAVPLSVPAGGAGPTKTVTQLRAAADILRVPLISPTTGTPDVGAQVADLRLGHFEMSIDVPAGGINCEIPIDKSGPPTVDIGNDATYTIKVPVDAAALSPFPCKLTSITVTDIIELEKADTPGKPPQMNIVSATGPPGSKVEIAANKQSVTFTNVPNYTPGSPPLTFTIKTTVPATSGQGRLKNTARATAVPGECALQDALVGELLGGAAFFGSAGSGLTGTIQGNSSNNVTGTDVVAGIGIQAGKVLAVTGRNDTMFLGLALAALLSAAGAVRLRRRVHSTD